jgi:hypothetical protein
VLVIREEQEPGREGLAGTASGGISIQLLRATSRCGLGSGANNGQSKAEHRLDKECLRETIANGLT